MDKEQTAAQASNAATQHGQKAAGADRALREDEQTGNSQVAPTVQGPLTVRLASLPAAELSAVLDRAIEDYGRGISVYAIADALGVEHTTLYRQLVKHRESDWREAKVSRALAELEEAEEQLKTAPDALALTRARERCRAAQWQLERLMRRIYGQDVPQQAQAVQININLRREQALDVVAEQKPGSSE